jgi:hypothetical protein
MKIIKTNKKDYLLLAYEGWVIVFYKNEAVNFYADHGDVDEDYLYQNNLFKVLVDELHGGMDIIDVIDTYNTLTDYIYDMFKVIPYE